MITQIRTLITGGHLTPALNVLEEMKKQGFNDFIWVGRKNSQTSSNAVSAEYKIIKEKKIKFIHLYAGKVWHKWTLQTIWKGFVSTIMIPIGFIQAIFIIIKYKPNLILSFGGFVALPVVIAGKIFGKRIVTHEQSIVSGLANKIIAKFSDKIMVSWQESLSEFPAHKVVLTGNPIFKDILEIKSNSINFENSNPILYITGGNQGANNINRRIYPILEQLLQNYNIIHQTGSSSLTNDYEKAKKQKSELSDELKNRYIVRDYIYQDEIGEVFNKADLLLARSGANTCTDILTLGKLSILIPIPWSYRGEQLKNAKVLEELGLARILLQRDDMKPQEILDVLEQSLDNIKNKIGFNKEPLSEIREKAKKEIRFNASEIIVLEIKKLF